MYEIFAQLMKQRGLNVYKVSIATGIPNTTLYAWKNGVTTLKLDKLEKIADYFDVSVDYLLGKEEKLDVDVMQERKLREFRAFNEDIYALCLKISALNEADRKAVEHIVNSLSNK